LALGSIFYQDVLRFPGQPGGFFFRFLAIGQYDNRWNNKCFAISTSLAGQLGNIEKLKWRTQS
jgi:hypothetical protein